MPFTKEQLRTYWHTNKTIFNQKRREKRRLAKLGLAIPEQVSRQTSQVSRHPVSHLKTTTPRQVSHEQPNPKTANPLLTHLLQKWLTSLNYSCAPTCSNNKYCSNCWYFSENELIDYKNPV